MIKNSNKSSYFMKEDKLSKKSILCYGIGGIGVDFPFVIICFLLTYFYTNVVGIDMKIVGMVIFISKFFDGTSDLIFGAFLSRTRTKWGKCRPWLLRMLIPVPISLILLVTVPDASMAIKSIYIFVTYNLASTVVYTMYGITYNSMNAVLTRQQEGRTTLSVTRQVFCFIGQIVLNGISLPLMDKFGNTQTAWIVMIAIYGILNSVCIFINFWGCPEVDPGDILPEQSGEKTKKQVPFRTEMKAVVTNKYWWMILIVWTFLALAQTTNSMAATYYSQYIIGDVKVVGILNTSENVMMMLGVFCIPLLLKKFSRRQLGLTGIIFAILAQGLVLIFPTNVSVLMVAGAIRGIGVAPLQALTYAMLSDVVEHVQWSSHIRTEGVVFAASSFGQKIASGIGTAAVSFLYDSAGFDGMQAVQSAASMEMIKNVYYFCMPVCCVIILIVYYFYNLDKEYPQIMSDLKERESQGKL